MPQLLVTFVVLYPTTGLEHISAALGEGACPKLQTLDLCFNDIETEAAESLAKALRDSDRTALQHLELNGNCIKV